MSINWGKTEVIALLSLYILFLIDTIYSYFIFTILNYINKPGDYHYGLFV